MRLILKTNSEPSGHVQGEVFYENGVKQLVSAKDFLSPTVIKALTKELAELQKTPCEGIKTIINEDNLTDVQAEIEGPVGTPYEGGLFRMKLVIGPDFPNAPPKGYFTTRIFHPNVSTEGEICVNVLKKDWKPDLGIRHVLLVVRCLLIEPNPDSALNEEAGRLLMEDYEEYARRAKLMTNIHAFAQKRALMPVCSNADDGAIGVGGNVDSPAAKKVMAPTAKPAAAAAAAAATKKAVKRL